MTPDRLAAIRAEFERWYVAEWRGEPAPVWLPMQRQYERRDDSLLLIGWEAACAHYCDGEATGPGEGAG